MNQELILEGLVVDIREPRSGQRADGTTWTQQTYALQIDAGGGYTSLVAFDLFGERIRQADIKQGERLAVWVNARSELYEGRYYTHLRAYHVSRRTAAQPIARNAADSPANGTANSAANSAANGPTYSTANGPANSAAIAPAIAPVTTATTTAATTAATGPVAPAPAAAYATTYAKAPAKAPAVAPAYAAPAPVVAPQTTLPGMNLPPRRDWEDGLPF